ncbi:GMC family oxidoreductase N-terminal domain-containing protein [Methanobacterium aggregans]|uniref:GMC family oxidoreductase N-terminal domain-containing protein n=1 Tax=Methanobacterium aggregans TaxID=1615586 RepID=UPI001AE6209B|nr:GMC family oxidoreductase N-terminal domain-containing protein [Methanobacterium aggregans]MBP2045255.1 choline dehydrogenase-like flavoprotein [Methanobacterium aggregans]
MIYDVIVVGTGAGGATAARELTNKGLNILILEKGSQYPRGTAVKHILNSKLSLKVDDELKVYEEDEHYNFMHQPAELMHIEALGGTTPVALANACYACTSCYANSVTAQFKLHDLDLFEELIEASKDLKVGALPADMMGPSTRKIVEVGEKLGHFMEPMPKFLDFEKCNKCGECINGCKRGAKWDSTDFIQDLIEKSDDSSKNGETRLITDFKVTRVLHKGQEVEGVEGFDDAGNKKEFKARRVVLAAGALNTPVILKNSGITEGVGEGLFTDMFITVGGFLKDAKLNKEIPMGVKSEFGPYFISPHFSTQILPSIKGKGFDASYDDIIGFMVKIADEANGRVHDDGSAEKTLTARDLNLLREGYHKAVEILLELGVALESISSTAIRGAHPGGTAAIGVVVDSNLETRITGLYVSDASVIPQAPGRPPILTITAIAKKLSKNLLKDME